MSIPRVIYLLLAIVGLAMTWYHNLQFISDYGGSFDIAQFMADSSGNPASRSLSWDLAIACWAGLVWIFLEARRLGLRFGWLSILRTCGVAWAFACPLFLFVRQGRLERSEQAEPAGAAS